MYIGIISYLPNDPKKRAARKKAHAEQLIWIRSLYPSETINIVAQNYEDEDYHRGINYFKFDKGIGAAKARNVILEAFYKTSETWLLLMDDDVILYNYYDGHKLLREFENNPKYKNLDSITANNPKYVPFKKENYIDKNIQTHWKFTKRPFNTGACFAVYKNVKDVLFDETTDEIGASEDVDFHIRWIMKGHSAYICSQWQIKDLSGTNSTYFTSERVEEEKERIRKLLKLRRLDIYKNGKVNWKELDKYNKTAKVGYIKRSESYTYKDNEIPT